MEQQGFKIIHLSLDKGKYENYFSRNLAKREGREKAYFLAKWVKLRINTQKY